MSQKVFADHVGVRPYVIAELEVSRYPRASPKRLAKLATFLGVNVNQLNPTAQDSTKGQRGGRWPKPEQPSQHAEDVEEEIAQYDRPITRADCLTSVQRYHNLHAAAGVRGIEIDAPDSSGGDGEPDGHNCQRPCPFVSCTSHLFVDVNQKSKGLKLNFPEFDVWQLASMTVAQLSELDDDILETMETEHPGSTFPSCSLDVADIGGITLDRVGVFLKVTRERARQLDQTAQLKYKSALIDMSLTELEDYTDHPMTADRELELRSLRQSQIYDISTSIGESDSYLSFKD